MTGQGNRLGSAEVAFALVDLEWQLSMLEAALDDRRAVKKECLKI